MTQQMANATMRDHESMADDSGFVPVDAVFNASAAGSDLDRFEGLGLGERLRLSRTDAGLTLDSASARTRIKRDYLEALETMDPRGLPSRAYAVGYLRTYAAFLGLDVAICVDQFKAEVDCEAGRAEPTAPQERREIKLPRGLVGAILILGGVLAAAGWYGNYITRSDTFAGAGAPMDTLMRAEAPLVSLDGRSAPSQGAIWGALPDARGVNNIVLEAAGRVDIEVRDASGRILASRELEPGEIYRAPDEPGLTISTNDAGALLVRAAGRPLGALGEQGQAVDDVSAAEFVLTAMRDSNPG